MEKFEEKVSEQWICDLKEELDQYYSTFDPCTEMLLEGLGEADSKRLQESSYMRKAGMHTYLSEACPIHLFRNLPFYFEMSSGRGRFTWGGLQSPVGNYFQNLTAEEWLKPYAEEVAQEKAAGYFWGWRPVGADHHCPDYERILHIGITGIIKEAKEALAICEDSHKKEFYRSVIKSNEALIHLAERFAKEAEKSAENSNDPKEKEHFQRIAKAASHAPAYPAESFYEALCSILFYRECVSSMEGIGISTFGNLDLTLAPFYAKDMAEGRITKEEAEYLIGCLLLYTNTRFASDGESFHETSTTIEIGGCDRDGKVIYNELTCMILETAVRVRSINTKINCRISKSHPTEFLEKIAQVQLAKLPCVMMHNDDVLIPAKVKQGLDIEDARIYLGCGCHEILSAGTEVCTRADSWISMPRLLLKTVELGEDCTEYQQFYDLFLRNVRAYHDHIAARKNKYEAKWAELDPLPLFSSSYASSLEKGLDVTEGGAKYNHTSLSMLGTATLIDSLYVIRKLIFEEKAYTLAQFRDILTRDFAGEEVLRQRILNQLPKHGTNHEEVDVFAAKVLEDLSQVSGQDNARKGKYLPAFYPHDIYRPLGAVTGATPDGRLKGQPLSRGISPSEFIETDSPLDIIHSLKAIDFTAYAESFCAEIHLPDMPDTKESMVRLIAIIKAFLEAEGSSMQFNLVDREQLLEARKHPELHKNLLVRVCGYSAVYVSLAEETQEEILQRAIR